MGLGLPVKDYLDDLLRKIGEAYLDGNLAMKANSIMQNQQNTADTGSDADDEDENFEKGQRTQRQDDLDSYS